MNVTGSLQILTIMTPFMAAITIRLLLRKKQRRQHQLALAAITLTGLLSLALFFGRGIYRCTLAPGPDNCLWAGTVLLLTTR